MAMKVAASNSRKAIILAVNLAKLSLILSTMRRTMRTLISILIIASFTVTPAIAADYYTWVDENGVTNYGERNPPGYQAEFVTRNQRFGKPIQPRDETPEPVASNSASDNTSVDPDALVAEERDALRAKIASVKASNCEIGKRNLVQLEGHRRIRVNDDNGENRLLTQDEKQAKADEAREVIRENCVG